MLNRAPLFLALRYLRPKRSFVSVITVISVLGVMVGVLMMVVVQSVMGGFESEFRRTLIGSEPHVLISKASPATAEALPWRKVLAAVQAQQGTTSVTPVAGGILYGAKDDQQTAFQVLGVSPQEGRQYLGKLQKHLLDGSLHLPDGSVVLSDYQAQELGVIVGDEISVYPSQNVNEVVRKFRAANDEEDKEKKKAAYQAIRLRPKKVTVSGVLRAETGGYYGYLSLKTGQDLFGLGDEVTGIAVELQDPEQAAAFTDSLKAAAPGWNFQMWTDANKARLAAMRNEQTVMMVVLLTIALVAAFSVMSTTITVTTQKRREIGVLTSLGAGQNDIVKIFVYQATVVGVLGTVLGLVGSLLILEFRNEIRQAMTVLTGGQVHAVEGVFLATIPAHIQPWEIAKICLRSVSLCIVAGFIPAWFAARADPAVALRD